MPCCSSSASTRRRRRGRQPSSRSPTGSSSSRTSRPVRSTGAGSACSSCAARGVVGPSQLPDRRRGHRGVPAARVDAAAEVPTLTGRAAFRVEGLDATIGGGIPVGDSVLIAGPSGVGKTLLALQFVNAGLRAGERCLYLSFQETAARLREKALAAGIDWSGDAGDRLTIRHVAPVELDLDEVGALLQDELAGGDVKRVVVDSIDELAFAARDTTAFPATCGASPASCVPPAARPSSRTNSPRSAAAAASTTSRSSSPTSSCCGTSRSSRRCGAASRCSRCGRATTRSTCTSSRSASAGIRFGEQLGGVSGLLGWSALSG